MVTGSELLVSNCWFLIAGSWLRLLVIGYWLLAMPRLYWPGLTGHQSNQQVAVGRHWGRPHWCQAMSWVDGS